MRIKKKNKFIVSMILDDLTNTKLVSALQSLNLEAGHYYTNIGDKVMQLMGFTNPDQNELVYEYYLDLLERGKYISLKKNYDDMRKLAKEIYAELKLQKPIKD